MSDETNQNSRIFNALANFQKEYVQIKFDATVKVQTKTGGCYSFQYATLSNIIETLRPCLCKHGLSLFQVTEIVNDRTYLVTFLNHVSGEQLRSVIEVYTHINKVTADGKIISVQLSNQDFGAELSYKKRYQISLITGTVADENTDANESSVNNTKGFKKENTKPVEPKQNAPVTKQNVPKQNSVEPKKAPGTLPFDRKKFDSLFTPAQLVAYFESLLPVDQEKYKQEFADKVAAFKKKKAEGSALPQKQAI